MAKLDTPLSERFDIALALAHRFHRDQARKGTAIPYIAHLLGVTALVLEYGGTEDEAIAALLHDAIEDAPEDLQAAGVRREIREQLGAEVLEIVEHCTDTDTQPKPPWMARKTAYLESLERAPVTALRVSAADKLHNVLAIARDYRMVGDDLWSRFNADAGRNGVLGYYRALAEVFRRRMPGALADALDRAVSDLEELTGARVPWPPQ